MPIITLRPVKTVYDGKTITEKGSHRNQGFKGGNDKNYV